MGYTTAPMVGLGALGLVLVAPGLTERAAAADAETTTFQAMLHPLNHSNASGWLTVELDGRQATIHEEVSGLAATYNDAPYPHLQHIDIGGTGSCPTPAADTDEDGVVSMSEAAPASGTVSVTLSRRGGTSPSDGTNIALAPAGDGFGYSRTIMLDPATIAAVRAGTAVVVVHGLDPLTLSRAAQGAKSDVAASLSLAQTSPALCGVLEATQMEAMPSGPAETGDGGPSTEIRTPWAVSGAAALVGAAGLFVVWRRSCRG